MRRAIVVAALAALVVLVPAALAGGQQKVTLTLDWTPNPDHVGIFDAQATGLFAQAGLDVAVHSPSDPTAPLKLVGVGRSDVAVSYEQELFFAAAKKLPVVAVAAVVPQPLNSFMAIDPEVKSVHDLKGRTIGITGVPSDYATLDTALHSVGLTRKDVKVVTVGYNLLPALLAHRVDAVLGVYRNVEGIQLQLRGLHPAIIPVDRAGVPTYDELVLVANKTRLRDEPGYRSEVRRFVAAFLAGTADARRHPARALAILEKVTASDRRFLARATPATLRLLTGPDGVGCISVGAWQRFGDWMRAQRLLKAAIPAASVVDASFLPSRCH
ncbi:MAG TPA: ABC transporter substrate-binding protein [Gaiellaceae bacterium]|jgi:putative hydroxymethylpyrimidine transport system substrate-binding protein|nr:ABC transporter substrate-binding protein [Gaiellaceae bacterium]